MADTIEGARLTELHRVLQVRLSTQAMAATRLLWSTLDPADLDRARDTWMRQQLQLMKVYDEKSALAAADYMKKFRVAEGVGAGPIVAVDEFDPDWAESSLGYNGPAKIQALTAAGVAPEAAKSAAFGQFAASAQRIVLGGGRRVMDQSALANPVSNGWRRVADANPCTFCAMLVSRGNAYRDAKSAGRGRHWHRRCGCTVEEVFGDWSPNAQEQRYIDAYDEAAARLDRLGQPHTKANILGSMRARGEFNDSPGMKPKPKPAPQVEGQAELPKPRKERTARQTPADVLDFNTRELRRASDADLEDALSRALESDHPSTDRLMAELDRRDEAPIKAQQQKALRAEAARNKRASAKEAQWDEVQRRINAGEDPRSAVADVTGVSIEKQMRLELAARLDAEGVPGRSLDDKIRYRYRQETARAYVDAENETRGHMLSRQGEARGIDPANLFHGPEARARKWASDELKEYWDLNGRLTLDDYRNQLLTGGLGTGRRVDDFLT